MLQIIKKELKQMFVSPAYFLILAVFIGILNFLFLKGFFINNQMNLRDYFDLQMWFLMIFIPAISMKIMSEEFKNGSLEYLITKPISLLKIIFGKYLSLCIYFGIFIFSTIFLYFSLTSLGSFPSGIILGQLLGSILLILAMFAISFLASSITKNQVFAFLLGVLINFILIIIGTDIIQMSLPYFISNLLNSLSYFSHVSNFAKGLISISDILYFLSIIFFSIYLSYLSVNTYKKSGSIGLGFISSFELVIVLVILFLANGIISKTNIFIDLTPNKVYTLSDSTKSILSKTSDIVNLELYVSKELPPELNTYYTNIKDLVKQFNNYSGNNLHLTEIHPVEDDKESEAMQNGISPIQIQIMKDDQFTTQKGYLGIAIKYLDKSEIIPYLGNTKNLEYSLISKILKITNDNKKTISIVSSDDIDNKVVYAMNQVLSENYNVNMQIIDKDTKSLNNKSDDLYLVLEGDNKFGSGIVSDIESKVKTNPVLYFFQPIKLDLSNGIAATKNQGILSKDLLDKFNLELEDGIVGDAKYNSSVNLSQGFMSFRVPYPLFSKTFINKELPISEGLDTIDTPFISSIKSTGSGITIKDILSTSEFGFNYNNLSNISPTDLDDVKQSNLKEISLAKFISDGISKVVFIPNTYMFTLGGQQTLVNNLGFVSNLVDYIGGDSRLINIRGKTLTYESFVVEKDKKSLIRTLNIFVLPILLVIIGISIAFVRSRARN